MREHGLKLFGMKIQLTDTAGEVAGDHNSGVTTDQEQSIQVEEFPIPEEISETEPQENDRSPTETEESPNENQPSQESDENLEQDSSCSPKTPKSETEQNEPQKTLKKPDKILPCPRCASMDTKFCYYNNYNVNQPRHFCKGCQRYWTAGGTMRNVPVGSGRRKNKSSPSSHYSHHVITISEAALGASYEGLVPSSLSPNATVLSFGPNPKVVGESMASTLSTAEEKTAENNGYHYKAGEGGSVSCRKANTKNDDCCNGVKNGVPQPFLSAPWPSPPPWNHYAAFPAFYPPSPYWLPNAWNIPPWLSSPSQESPLGEHSGEKKKKNLEASIVVPKTLRIDDPEEAAKSSIWETLGIKYDSAQRQGLFKALQAKHGKKRKISASNSSVLGVNPAALSRSITFQEAA